ncbi:MAG: precorrin-3B C(17)-methyltransferase [Bacilli bacterium]|nr:precorrin-3B C(17)-methyltransferase [Bacilli bacterium]
MGKLFVVGVGSGNHDDITIKADKILNHVELIYSDDKIAEKLKPFFGDKLVKNEYKKTIERCENAINSAKLGKNVAITGSGDTGVYGIASIIIGMAEDNSIDLKIIPGVTSAISGAALLGAPIINDFAVISLSSNLSNKEDMKKRLIAAATTDLNLVLYSPNNKEKSNLLYAKEILLSYLDGNTKVGIVSNIGNNNQQVLLKTLEDLSDDIDENSTIFVGNTKTIFTKTKKMTTELY